MSEPDNSDLPEWLQPDEEDLRFERLRKRAETDPDLAWLLERYDDYADKRAEWFADRMDEANR